MDVDNIPYISFLYQENYNSRGEMDYFFHGVTFQVKTKIGHFGNSARSEGLERLIRMSV